MFLNLFSHFLFAAFSFVPQHSNSYVLTNDVQLSSTAAYLTPSGEAIYYNPATCPDPSSPDFDYCTRDFEG